MRAWPAPLRQGRDRGRRQTCPGLPGDRDRAGLPAAGLSGARGGRRRRPRAGRRLCRGTGRLGRRGDARPGAACACRLPPAARGHPRPGHWLRVLENGRTLAAATPGADPALVELFALLHDSRRLDEDGDRGHGERAAAYVRDSRGEGMLDLGSERVALLAAACARHEMGEVSADPTIGCCWDADRLELARLGRRPIARLLSTAAALDPGIQAAAWQRGIDRCGARRSRRGMVTAMRPFPRGASRANSPCAPRVISGWYEHAPIRCRPSRQRPPGRPCRRPHQRGGRSEGLSRWRRRAGESRYRPLGYGASC